MAAITFFIGSQNDYSELNNWLFEQISHRSIVCLNGGLGAGKTTFLSQFCKQFLGIQDIHSPTYAIINMHDGQINGSPISVAHCDLYRLKNKAELLDIGIEDVLHDSDFCFIEWPEYITSLIDQYICLNFTELEDGQRMVKCVMDNMPTTSLIN